jgi:NADH-quinone oxidoreductase subunit F
VAKPCNIELPLGIPFADLLALAGGVWKGRKLKAVIPGGSSVPCGQCTPCREGTGWLDRMLKRILAGQGRSEDLGLLMDVANRIEGHTICALGDAAAWPVQSFLKHYRHEFQYMIEHQGRSIVEGQPAVAA